MLYTLYSTPEAAVGGALVDRRPMRHGSTPHTTQDTFDIGWLCATFDIECLCATFDIECLCATFDIGTTTSSQVTSSYTNTKRNVNMSISFVRTGHRRSWLWLSGRGTMHVAPHESRSAGPSIHIHMVVQLCQAVPGYLHHARLHPCESASCGADG